MDLEDRLRRNDLRILGIKEDLRESFEECENKIYGKERAIVVQFSFYKDKIDFFRNCKKLEVARVVNTKLFSRD